MQNNFKQTSNRWMRLKKQTHPTQQTYTTVMTVVSKQLNMTKICDFAYIIYVLEKQMVLSTKKMCMLI